MSGSPTPALRGPGHPWGEDEKRQRRAQQRPQRSYQADVVDVLGRLRARVDVVSYGRLDYPPDSHLLYAVRTRGWRDDRPYALVTGGVHGYETSGVHGALRFAER